MIAVNSKAAVITLCLKHYRSYGPNKYLNTSFEDDLKILVLPINRCDLWY